MDIRITVHFVGRVAHVDMSDGSHFDGNLNDGETEQQFMERLESIIRATFGDRIKSLKTSETPSRAGRESKP